MERHTGTAAVVLALLVSLLWVPAAAADDRCDEELPGLGVRLLEAPAALVDDPRAQVSIIDDLAPGATIERRVRFSNGDPDEALPVRLYATSASIADGDFRVAEGRVEDELTGWTTISADDLVLEPCSGTEVTVTIAVPADAEAGERYGLVAAEHQPAVEPGEVVVASRIGVRTYLHVAGQEPARPELEVETIRPGRDAAGHPTVDIVVDNPGGRAIDVTGEIELTDGPGGLRAGPFPTGGATTLAPGDRGEVGITLDPSLPDGPWRVEVTLRSGQLEERAEAIITFPEAGQGEAVPLHPLQDRGVLLPIAAALLALALLLLLLAWRRRRDDDTDEDEGDAPAADDGARALVGTG